MKSKMKKLITILAMGFAVFLAITILFGKAKLALWDVEKVVINSTDYDIVFDSIELDRSEIARFLWRYNFSINAGFVDVDRPYSDFSVKIYLENGDTISLRDYRNGKLYYSAPEDRCWIYNPGLLDCIDDLIAEHDMERE